MKVVAAYLLAVLGGNSNPTVDDIKAILGSVGIEVEDERIELLVSQVKGKDLAEVVACGRQKMASVPSAGAAVSMSATGQTATCGAPAAESNLKEEKKEVVVEESDEDMCFSLFD